MGMRSFLFFLAILSAPVLLGAENEPVNVPAAAAPAPADPEVARNVLAEALNNLTNAPAAEIPSDNTVAVPSVTLVNRDVLDNVIKLQPGDVVRYRVQEDKEEVKRLNITDGGEIEIPYLGHIRAQGKTCKELAAEVKNLLEQDFYKRATVNIAVETVVKKSLGRIWVFGAVAAPGAQEMPPDEPWTVSKAVLRAGPTEFANKSKVKLKKGAMVNNANGIVPPVEERGKKDEYIYIDVDQIFKKGRSEKDVPLEPGDLIIVDSLFVNFK